MEGAFIWVKGWVSSYTHLCECVLFILCSGISPESAQETRKVADWTLQIGHLYVSSHQL